MDANTIVKIKELNKKIDDLNLNRKNMTTVKFLEEKSRYMRELQKIVPK